MASASFRYLAFQACCARTVPLRAVFGLQDGMKGMSWFGGQIHRDPVSATWSNLGIEVQHRRIRAILNMIRFEQ